MDIHNRLLNVYDLIETVVSISIHESEQLLIS